jgi:AraC-like DNA-binding protein
MKSKPVVMEHFSTVHTSFVVDFTFTNNITILMGDSGTGKTATFSFIRECMAVNPQILCLDNYDYQKDIKEIIRQTEGKLVVIDNADILLDDLKQYIRNNCLRCEFSIQETAEHFHMLLPNLSQFFKEKTGGNILDYSTQIRMQKAKDLLADSKLTLKDISQQVGYYNVSSFIRRFKQIEGMTPGDYRKYLTSSLDF